MMVNKFAITDIYDLLFPHLGPDDHIMFIEQVSPTVQKAHKVLLKNAAQFVQRAANKNKTLYIFRQSTDVYHVGVRTSDIKEVSIISVDYDHNDEVDWTGVLVPPTLIMVTSTINKKGEHGVSYQAHWVLADPQTDIAAVERLTKVICAHHKYDPKMNGVRQIARAPGSTHQRSGEVVSAIGGTGVVVFFREIIAGYKTQLDAYCVQEAIDLEKARVRREELLALPESDNLDLFDKMSRYAVNASNKVVKDDGQVRNTLWGLMKDLAAICIQENVSDTIPALRDIVLSCVPADYAHMDDLVRQMGNGVEDGWKQTGLNDKQTEKLLGWKRDDTVLPNSEDIDLLEIIRGESLEPEDIYYRKLCVLAYVKQQGFGYNLSQNSMWNTTYNKRIHAREIDFALGKAARYLTINAKGEPVQHKPSVVLEENPNNMRYEFIDTINHPLGKEGYHNIYVDLRMPVTEINSEIMSRVKAYYDWAVPAEDEREAMFDWIAFLYQNPGIKNLHYLELHSSIKRSGKTWTMNMIMGIMGEQDKSEINMHNLVKGYNESLFGKCFGRKDEMKTYKSFEGLDMVAELLKSHCHSGTQENNVKSGAVSNDTSYANLCWTLNRPVFDYEGDLTGRILRVNFTEDNGISEPADIRRRIEHMASFFKGYTHREVLETLASYFGTRETYKKPCSAPAVAQKLTNASPEAYIMALCLAVTRAIPIGETYRGLQMYKVLDRVAETKLSQPIHRACAKQLQSTMDGAWKVEVSCRGEVSYERL